MQFRQPLGYIWQSLINSHQDSHTSQHIALLIYSAFKAQNGSSNGQLNPSRPSIKKYKIDCSKLVDLNHLQFGFPTIEVRAI